MTGVVNELGVDIAEIFHSEGEKRRLIQREALLRVIVMCSFLLGAIPQESPNGTPLTTHHSQFTH